jgi:hypothetical protein
MSGPNVINVIDRRHLGLEGLVRPAIVDGKPHILEGPGGLRHNDLVHVIGKPIRPFLINFDLKLTMCK